MASKSIPFANIRACVFDAYGTLLDVNAAAQRCADELGELAGPLSELWRTKQVQYTWLSSLMGRHRDFYALTQAALDFAMETLGLQDAPLRAKLMALYEELDAYPEVPQMLADVRAAGLKTAILSNGTPQMLQSAVAAAGIGDALDAILSVEEVGVYKTDPRVYQLAVAHLGVAKEAICFVSSNGWDAAGAVAFGFQVAWVNRTGQVGEKLGLPPHAEVRDLTELAALIGANSGEA